MGAAGLTAGVMRPLRAAAASDARFQAHDGQFMLDGQPFQVLAGEMHYPRIARDLWRDRLRKLKSLGLNTLTTYVFWNAHEAQPGHFDFSDNLDIAAFVKLAQAEGLWVNLRPGPYACAEWDGGGLPAWLTPEPTSPVRENDPRFLDPVRRWFKRLGQELTPLLISNGGPIILTQVENEYGSYGDDHAYMQAVHSALEDAGFGGVFYTADGAAVIEGGQLPGLTAGINFGTYDKAENEFATRAKVRSDGPYFCSELWGGWFDHFGEMHSSVSIPPLIASLDWMLKNKCSISFYMLHGGTSWAFNAGANFDNDKSIYQPDISSYDYDAILDEAGRPTPKYEAVKALFQQHLPAERFFTLPAPEKALVIDRFSLGEAAPLSQLYGAARVFEAPQTLEALHQAHGLMLYRHLAKTALKGQLSFDDVRDYALLYAGSAPLGRLDRRLKQTSLTIDVPAGQPLDILVDTMGRINYGRMIGKDQKGLIGKAKLDGETLAQWAHYALPLDNLSDLTFTSSPVRGPAFFRGQFEVLDPGYTFIDMRGWGKGYVWVNGHNLGRYWEVGPQRALFCPAPWLKTGVNEIIVLDLDDSGERSVAGGAMQIWDLPGQFRA
jgi:beta-galactosidase